MFFKNWTNFKNWMLSLYCEQFLESKFRIHIEHFLSIGWTLFKETLTIFLKYAELFLSTCWTKFLYTMNIFYTHWTFFQCMVNILLQYGEQKFRIQNYFWNVNKIQKHEQNLEFQKTFSEKANEFRKIRTYFGFWK